MKLFSWVNIIFLIVFSVLFLTLSVRGNVGNPTPTQMNDLSWKDNGPFELSPERGRYALTYSLIEDSSFSFSLPLARFATPDLGYKDGKYVSLFAPGVSYAIIPGFLVGKFFGSEQVGSYAVIALFALLNVLLVRAIAIRLGAHPLAATLGALTFLFASPAFAYSVSLFQHQISVFLILASFYLLLRWNNILSLFAIFFLSALSVPIDNPNLILTLPIVIAAALKFFTVYAEKESYKISFSLLRSLSVLGVILPLVFFMWFNNASYGNPLQLAGTVSGVREIDAGGKPVAPKNAGVNNAAELNDPTRQQKSATGFFKTRNILNGLTVHVFGRDRGIIWFTPVMLLAIPGAYVLYKKRKDMTVVLIGIVGADILLYSLWGDPWGGWAFGSRYLIPSYAIAGLFISIGLTYIRRYAFLPILFTILFIYSVSVNTLGALTTNRNPPKVEILGLEALSGREEKYSYDRNIQYLNQNGVKSFAYNTFFAYSFSPTQYYYFIVSGILGFTLLTSGGYAIVNLKQRRKS